MIDVFHVLATLSTFAEGPAFGGFHGTEVGLEQGVHLADRISEVPVDISHRIHNIRVKQG